MAVVFLILATVIVGGVVFYLSQNRVSSFSSNADIQVQSMDLVSTPSGSQLSATVKNTGTISLKTLEIEVQKTVKISTTVFSDDFSTLEAGGRSDPWDRPSGDVTVSNGVLTLDGSEGIRGATLRGREPFNDKKTLFKARITYLKGGKGGPKGYGRFGLRRERSYVHDEITRFYGQSDSFYAYTDPGGFRSRQTWRTDLTRELDETQWHTYKIEDTGTRPPGMVYNVDERTSKPFPVIHPHNAGSMPLFITVKGDAILEIDWIKVIEEQTVNPPLQLQDLEPGRSFGDSMNISKILPTGETYSVLIKAYDEDGNPVLKKTTTVTVR